MAGGTGPGTKAFANLCQHRSLCFPPGSRLLAPGSLNVDSGPPGSSKDSLLSHSAPPDIGTFSETHPGLDWEGVEAVTGWQGKSGVQAGSEAWRLRLIPSFWWRCAGSRLLEAVLTAGLLLTVRGRERGSAPTRASRQGPRHRLGLLLPHLANPRAAGGSRAASPARGQRALPGAAAEPGGRGERAAGPGAQGQREPRPRRAASSFHQPAVVQPRGEREPPAPGKTSRAHKQSHVASGPGEGRAQRAGGSSGNKEPGLAARDKYDAGAAAPHSRQPHAPRALPAPGPSASAGSGSAPPTRSPPGRVPAIAPRPPAARASARAARPRGQRAVSSTPGAPTRRAPRGAMPFLGQDWRSPGQSWVKTADGWKRFLDEKGGSFVSDLGSYCNKEVYNKENLFSNLNYDVAAKKRKKDMMNSKTKTQYFHQEKWIYVHKGSTKEDFLTLKRAENQDLGVQVPVRVFAREPLLTVWLPGVPEGMYVAEKEANDCRLPRTSLNLGGGGRAWWIVQESELCVAGVTSAPHFHIQRHGYCTLGEAFNRLDFSTAILDSRRFNYVVRVSPKHPMAYPNSLSS
ncbi:F-box only protein 32 [Galemys pyrenaicus]|uniref:F-box only protein 32 n=1 Tax=Galemys pyrenaicus TaxID=202257 RepID=A0A8J6DN27_GALPY|nr:F-box only protein 32 [Galemys pyrenaicus]